MFIKSSETLIVVHLFYHDLWDEIDELLQSIDDNFDLFISTTSNLSKISLESISKYNFHIENHPNRGRDIAPFLSALSFSIENEYKYCCKIHTKKSPQTSICNWLPTISSGEEWRRDLFFKLLEKENYNKSKHALQNLEWVGIIAPEGHLVPIHKYVGANIKLLQKLCSKLRFEKIAYETNFSAGSMFWFKPECLQELIRLNLSKYDFEKENKQIDGTLAHALERFFPIVARYSGHEIKTLNQLKLEFGKQSSAIEFKHSFITRFHDFNKIEILLKAGKSILEQSTTSEWIILTKNFTEKQLNTLEERLTQESLIKICIIENVNFDDGIDGRSHLLNVGIKLSTARFVSFLDYDDIIYPEFSKSLTSVLLTSDCAVSVCASKRVLIDSFKQTRLLEDRPHMWGMSYDLLLKNFIPINSFAIDRNKVIPEDLYFDIRLDRLEDYDFILNLFSKYKFDYTYRYKTLSEYFFHSDHSNTSLELKNPTPKELEHWKKADAIVSIKKSNLHFQALASDFEEYIEVKELQRRSGFWNKMKDYVLHKLSRLPIFYIILKKSYLFLRKVNYKFQ